MDQQKNSVIENLLRTGSLTLKGEYVQSNGRIRPYKLDFGGNLSDGSSLKRISELYSQVILNSDFLLNKSDMKSNVLYGVYPNGFPLAVSTVLALAPKNNISYFIFAQNPDNEKDPVKLRNMIIGPEFNDGMTIIQLDDSFHPEKYSALPRILQNLGNFNYTGVVIGFDPQEVSIEGQDETADFEKNARLQTVPVISAREIVEYVTSHKSNSQYLKNLDLTKFFNYIRVFGTDKVKGSLGKLEQRIIDGDRKLIPYFGNPNPDRLSYYLDSLESQNFTNNIGAYLISSSSVIESGIGKIVARIRDGSNANKPIIYSLDDFSMDTDDLFKVLKANKINAVRIPVKYDPETLRQIIYNAFNNDLKPIVGDFNSTKSSGFIPPPMIPRAYEQAARSGVRNFAVPGKIPSLVKNIRIAIGSATPDDVSYFSSEFVIGEKIVEDSINAAGGKNTYCVVDLSKIFPNLPDKIKDESVELGKSPEELKLIEERKGRDDLDIISSVFSNYTGFLNPEPQSKQ